MTYNPTTLFLALSLLLLSFGCKDEDDPTTLQANNSVEVYVDGDLYFSQENNVFNVINRDIDSDGEERFSILIFATGRQDEAEDFSLLVDITELSDEAEIIPGSASIRFTQLGNDCSGTVLAIPDGFKVSVDRNGSQASGSLEGTFTDIFGTCSNEFRVEYEGLEVD